MKRLKYQSPFGGHQYPLIITLICASAICPIGLISDLPFPLRLPMVLSPLIAPVVCYFIIHHLTPDEKHMIENMAYPLWQPVTQEIKARVCAEQSDSQMSLSSILIAGVTTGGFAAVFCILPGKRGRRALASPETAVVIGMIVAVITVIYLMISKGVGANWLEIDDSAVYLQIPIDHMYDVEHHGRYGRTWVESYLVFYQPDGRYILHAPRGSGDCNTVTVVKYGKALTWFPSYERHPEDFSQ